MANDTQFYVLGILLLLLSVKFLKIVAFTVLCLIVSSWFTTFSIAYSNDYIARYVSFLYTQIYLALNLNTLGRKQC